MQRWRGLGLLCVSKSLERNLRINFQGLVGLVVASSSSERMWLVHKALGLLFPLARVKLAYKEQGTSGRALCW